MPDIFLSYNREDQAKARLIAKALSEEGFDVWWDTVLRAGQTYDEVTEGQLHAAKAVVVLWSSRSVRSKWVRAEATLGDRKSALIPVMIEQCDRPIMFELIQTADLVGWEGDVTAPAWRAFIADVRDHVDRKSAATRPVVSAAAAASAPATKEDPASADTIEAAFWMSIEDGDDAEEFESYLERYPKGHFASLARKRLATLMLAKAPSATQSTAEPAQPPQTSQRAAEQPTPVAQPPLFSTPSPKATQRPDAFHQKQGVQQVSRAGNAGRPLPLIAGLVGLGVLVLAAVFVAPGLLGGVAPTRQQEASSPAAPASGQASQIPAQTVSAAPAATEPAPAVAESVTASTPESSKTFRDCDTCPEMMRLAGGTFTMGSSATEPGHRAWEGPQREVTVSPVAIGLKEVTFSEWEACVAGGGCGNYAPADKGWGRGARPVIMVSWNDAQAYVKWLSGKTGKSYRLPTEAEWEYAARGGAATAYWWGDRHESNRAPRGKTEETGFGEPNGFGLYNVTGNAAEWVQDCYVNSFANAPKDGSAVSAGGGCQRVLRGGGWKADANDLRIANRSRLAPSTRDTAIGFRVAVTE